MVTGRAQVHLEETKEATTTLEVTKMATILALLGLWETVGHITRAVAVIHKDNTIQEMIDLQYLNPEQLLHSVQSGQIHILTQEILNISNLNVLLPTLDMGGIQMLVTSSKFHF